VLQMSSSPRKRKLTKEEIAELIERGYPEVFRWEDDELALKAAAAHSRLPHEKMSSQEMAAFTEIAVSKISTSIFLHIRNKILQLWHLEPNVECTKEHAYDQIMRPYNSDVLLIRRVHAYLERYGYINYGLFHKISAAPPHTRKKIVIVGAGVSGLAAARQLKQFGFDVVIVEGRLRTGGRVHTHVGTKTGVKADLGAMVLTGICGNPLLTLTKQFGVTLDRLNGSNCTVYDTKGRAIDKRKDTLVEEAFNRIGDIASYIVHEKGCDSINGKPIDLETAYDNILCLMELRTQKKRLQFYSTYEEVVSKMKGVLEEMNIYKKTVEEIGDKLKELESTPISEFNSKAEKEILRRCYKRDMTMAFKKYEGMEARKKNVDSFLANLRRLEPNSEVYMNGYDRRILDFHLANLEYANGTKLRNLSLKHWDQDDDNEIAGSHMTVIEGMGHIVSKFVNTADVLTGRTVTKIEYREDGVRVVADRTDGEGKKIGVEEYTADAVLCTLPLGILKRSAKGEAGGPVFDPPLPDRKLAAINRVGFGNLNKVVLIFDDIFWEDGIHFFGTTTTDSVTSFKGARGELYLFIAQTGKPCLTGLMAGEAADLAMNEDDPKQLQVIKEMCVSRAMEVLTALFGSLCPSSPREAIVTMWHKDKFSLGCYSFMDKQSEATDYDVLAESVRSTTEKGENTGSERLFFAGEHTNRNYPATVHGAMLSGQREAGRIADLFSGCPYATPENNVINLEMEEDEEEEEDDECIEIDTSGEKSEDKSGGGRGGGG
ncbi:hypothetical protein PFISCL1PPCAC_19562, partial [Pristionchus fissidentatus]